MTRKIVLRRSGGYDPKLGPKHPSNRDPTLEPRAGGENFEPSEVELRPMDNAPMTGPVVDVLVATTDRAGCNGWLIAHYADGGGEDQPRFRGWFFWTGFDFRQVDETTLLGWLPLPLVPSRRIRKRSK